MGFPEIVGVARNYAVMVRIQGPDPKGLKMREHAFHLYNSGKTTLSASGMLLPSFTYGGQDGGTDLEDDGCMLVLTVACVIEPFLSQKHRENVAKDKPQTIPGVQVDILVEGEGGIEQDFKDAKRETAKWLPAELLTIVNIPEAAAAVQSIVEASAGSLDHGWEVGWSLVSHADAQKSISGVLRSQVEQSSMWSQGPRIASSHPSVLGKSTTRIALLRVSSNFKSLPKLIEAPPSKRGDVLLAMGSPFGILSPLHFFNSIAVGSTANVYPPNSSKRSLLMADLKCLPGMEGGPVFGDKAQFIGILTRPLLQRNSSAEVQLLIPWVAIASACNDILKLNSSKETSLRMLHIDGSSGHSHGLLPSDLPSSVEKAMYSVCLISTADGAWASGVLLNRNGLILTNAHLLEPWRFKKASTNGERNRTKSGMNLVASKESQPLGHDGSGGSTIKDMQQRGNKTANVSSIEKGSMFSLSRKMAQRCIQVRLAFKEQWTWFDAKIIYVSKGPLDVALIQLEFVPDQLVPINMELRCPLPGSKVYVSGHGLFGPRCELLPSACLGVVAKVVEAKKLQISHSRLELSTQGHCPVMIETTAAVHPGGSGGAVIDMDGRMVGLVTSNSRHGGGIVIPHLNFSIPCSALEPIFNFSRDMLDLSPLDDLDKPNENIASIWALTPAISPKQDPLLPILPSLPEDKEKTLKGSRFSRFIAERQEFMKSTQTGDAGSISGKLLPSKL